MSNYKHGVYGEYIPSTEQISNSTTTIPIYIGTAPVHRLKNYTSSVNKALLINNAEEAALKLGYSENDNFREFTLSAAIYAHFKNKVNPIGPIICINVLNPATHMEALKVPASVTLTNGKAELPADTIIGTVVIDTKELGRDYDLSYTSSGTLLLSSMGQGLGASATVQYSKIKPANIVAADIVGSYDTATGVRKGLYCIGTVYEELNIVPNILSAPGYNHMAEVHNKLLELRAKIGGQWDTIVVSDLDTSTVTTIPEAIRVKGESNFNSNFEKLCWPMHKCNGKLIWGSIMTIVRMQQTDSQNGGIPFESPSNKPIDISGLALADGTEVKLNLDTANLLNAEGITTALFYGGRWVVWGPHMANFKHGITKKPEEIFDVNIRTNIYLNNSFKLRNAHLVDTPIARNDIDAIKNNEQIRLNSLISERKLLYAKVDFIATENPIGDLMNGNFVFDSMVTNTPPGKSITQRVQYTSAGLNSLVGGE